MIRYLKEREELEEITISKLREIGIRNSDYPLNSIEIAEKLGLVVRRQQFIEASICAMLVLGTENTGIIYNSNRTKASQNMSVMHELFHYWHHPKKNYVCSNKLNAYGWKEWQANNGAAICMMPTQMVIDKYHEYDGYYKDLKKCFNVSSEALKYRLESLGLEVKMQKQYNKNIYVRHIQISNTFKHSS